VSTSTSRVIRVVAGAILRSDGTVLAARRGPGRAHAGLWELPGGKVEHGEADAQALVRELGEELGVQVQVDTHLGTSRWEHVQLVAYVCRIVVGVPVTTEHTALRWVGPGDLHELAWAPADVPLLTPLAARLRR